MKKIYMLWVLLFLGSTMIFAQEKSVKLEQAGTLSKTISKEDKLSVKKLTVQGKINEADIAFMNEMSMKGVLAVIDLSESLFSETTNELLFQDDEYMLPFIKGLGTNKVEEMEAYEKSMGHVKDARSLPGFWMFKTNKELFFMTGYMNGWENTFDEAVLKTLHPDLLRSPQIRQWIEYLGYEYKLCRTDGDLIFHNKKNNTWCLLHFTPYNKNDYAGIHFSFSEYKFW